MSNAIFEQMESYDYENLFFCQEKTPGLKAIIAIHDTTLGPRAAHRSGGASETTGI